MKNNNNDNDLTKPINNEDNQTDSLDKMAETEPTANPNDPDTSGSGSDHPKDAGSAEDPVINDTGETALPPNVTTAPQDPEHMDLNLIRKLPSLLDAYLRVSDSTSGLHGDEAMETEARRLCGEYHTMNWDEIKDPMSHLEMLREFSAKYTLQCNIAESVTDGVNAKSRIRQGILFNIQKKLVKMTGQNWTFWFNNNHNSRHLRSVQDYMAVASIPNAIRYAVFGIKRLKEIKRAFTITKEDRDPIGRFLGERNLTFDPDAEDTLDDFKKEVDVAIALTKIEKAEEKEKEPLGVDAALVKDMVFRGIPVDTGVIKNLLILKANQGNVNSYLKKRYLKGGDEDPTIIANKSIVGFPKLVSGINDVIDFVEKDLSRAEEIDITHIDKLEEHTAKLRKLITDN